ncbi:MAG TPA: hypothetical protein DCQ16_00715 [Spirochaetaceae bacterium]|nr:hypothetical protein [Spirochaetaceae bacterium]
MLKPEGFGELWQSRGSPAFDIVKNSALGCPLFRIFAPQGRQLEKKALGPSLFFDKALGEKPGKGLVFLPLPKVQFPAQGFTVDFASRIVGEKDADFQRMKSFGDA